MIIETLEGQFNVYEFNLYFDLVLKFAISSSERHLKIYFNLALAELPTFYKVSPVELVFKPGDDPEILFERYKCFQALIFKKFHVPDFQSEKNQHSGSSELQFITNSKLQIIFLNFMAAGEV